MANKGSKSICVSVVIRFWFEFVYCFEGYLCVCVYENEMILIIWPCALFCVGAC